MGFVAADGMHLAGLALAGHLSWDARWAGWGAVGHRHLMNQRSTDCRPASAAWRSGGGVLRGLGGQPAARRGPLVQRCAPAASGLPACLPGWLAGACLPYRLPCFPCPACLFWLPALLPGLLPACLAFRLPPCHATQPYRRRLACAPSHALQATPSPTCSRWWRQASGSGGWGGWWGGVGPAADQCLFLLALARTTRSACCQHPLHDHLAPPGCRGWCRVQPKLHAPHHHLRLHHRVAVFDILPGAGAESSPQAYHKHSCWGLPIFKFLEGYQWLMSPGRFTCPACLPACPPARLPACLPACLQGSRPPTAPCPSGTSPTSSARQTSCASWPHTWTGALRGRGWSVGQAGRPAGRTPACPGGPHSCSFPQGLPGAQSCMHQLPPLPACLQAGPRL